MAVRCGLAVVGIVLMLPAPLRAVMLNQVDNFQNGTTHGWTEGPSSPNQPANISTGGPGGGSDRYLRNASNGGLSAGGRMVMFNTGQWTGDYTEAGITRLEADMINLGSTTLRMRIALAGNFSYFASTAPVVLAPGSGWQKVSFELDPAGLTRVSGSDSLATVLGDVGELRILSSVSATYIGDVLTGTLGMDNLTAVPEPASALLLALGGWLGLHRRRVQRA